MIPPDREREITYFAETDFRGVRRRFGIRRRDRRAHMYILGRTGMGKSTLLETLIASDLSTGKGLALLDPHGDLAMRVLERIPESRRPDVIDFRPPEHVIPYNPLRVTDPSRRALVVSGLISAFRKAWAEFWGPRMEHILRYSLLALTEVRGGTLLDLPRLLTEPAFQQAVLRGVTDLQVRSFWLNEFGRYAPPFRSEAVSPILNKVGAFVASPVIRAIVGNRTASLDLRQVMDQGEVLVANLAKGRLGEDTSGLLGALLLAGFEQAALSRADVPEDRRPDFYLYVDELQNVATLSLAGMLEEARKYRLSLILAHQYLGQLDERLQRALLGTIGTLIAFRVGAQDAKLLAEEFFPELRIEDLVGIGQGQMYLRLMVDGAASRGFGATTVVTQERLG